jgi:enhancing lycopene biosynthesis protein 2
LPRAFARQQTKGKGSMMLNTRLTNRLLLATLCLLMGAISAAPASAAMIYGDNIHTASGNDRNASDISDVLSDLAGEYVHVEELARVEFDEGSNPSDGLELVINEFKVLPGNA